MKQLTGAIVREGFFGRFYIFHPTSSQRFAWSGSRWVSCTCDGLPTPPDNTQVCNFSTEREALDYIRGFE